MANNSNQATPILISGIGRSGTSALLQALATHSEIYTAEKIGEAPFVSSFLNFLVKFENESPIVEYNLKNYRLEDETRRQVFSDFIMKNQCGNNIDLDEPGKKYWIAKASLGEKAYEKAQEVFGEIRIVYIMRNGIEVVNSARNFEGFADLTFRQLCTRWKENIEISEYQFDLPLASVVKHDELVAKPDLTFSEIFTELGLTDDPNPADFINTNLFNSSFDEKSKDSKAKESFKNRLNAWDSWSIEEQQIFIDECDFLMEKYNFIRPYASLSSSDEPMAEDSTSSADTSSIITVEQKENQPAYEQQTSTDGKSDLSLKIQAMISNEISDSYFNYVCNISAKYNYVFMNVPKVASTSILEQMQLAEDSEQIQCMQNVHDRASSPLHRLSHYSMEEQNKLLFEHTHKRLSLVRNPYNRLLSAFLSKIDRPLQGWKVDPGKPNLRPPKADILAVIKGKKASEIDDMSTGVSFDEFVDVVCSQSLIDMDIHWKPQYAIVQPESISYDYIGRMEDFEQSFTEIRQISGVSEMKIPDISENNTGSSSKMGIYYSNRLALQVYDKYFKDFEIFDYSESININNTEAA